MELRTVQMIEQAKERRVASLPLLFGSVPKPGPLGPVITT